MQIAEGITICSVVWCLNVEMCRCTEMFNYCCVVIIKRIAAYEPFTSCDYRLVFGAEERHSRERQAPDSTTGDQDMNNARAGIVFLINFSLVCVNFSGDHYVHCFRFRLNHSVRHGRSSLRRPDQEGRILRTLRPRRTQRRVCLRSNLVQEDRHANRIIIIDLSSRPGMEAGGAC